MGVLLHGSNFWVQSCKNSDKVRDEWLVDRMRFVVAWFAQRFMAEMHGSQDTQPFWTPLYK
jgi:hypothetical protein